jgi:hypothetical protein
METFFTNVAPKTIATREGSCDVPIVYRDASQFGVFFVIDLARARRMIGDRAIEPWPVMGRAVGAIYAWDYRDSSVGAYGEVGLGIQSRRRGSKPSLVKLATDMGADDDQGIWVVSLPVTTQGAYAAGVEIWGYPKYVTDITTDFDDAEASVTLGAELRLKLTSSWGPTLAGQPIVTYTERDGRLIRTRIDVDHRVRWGSGRGARLDVIGDGPTAKAARELGLDRAPIVASFRVDRFRAKLPAGVDLGPIR